MNNLRQNGVHGDKLCEVEASAKWYAKNQRETPLDRGLPKVTKYVKEHDLQAVPFFKGDGFCVKRKSKYQTKPNQALDCPQFSRIEASDDNIKFQNLKKTLTALYWN